MFECIANNKGVAGQTAISTTTDWQARPFISTLPTENAQSIQGHPSGFRVREHADASIGETSLVCIEQAYANI